VLTTPGVNSEAVAEMAFALALTVARRTARFERMLRAGDEIVRPRHLGVQLQGKTVGVVGMGNIGSAVARKWLGAFDARLVAFDPHAPADRWPDLPHRRVASLAELLASSDVVTLHLPLTERSRGMIGSAELALMKRDAILINVSRGGIIDERALFDAMSAGHLFGAGLDVFEVEPPPADHPLLQLENLVATPHAAGGTHETQERSALQVARQVIEVLQGLPPRHRVA
jgi:D-3-phosphoglycerate dehydrogenase